MKSLVLRSLVAAGMLFTAANANALPLRAPQIPFASLPLQGYMNIVDSGITAVGSQLAAQAWSIGITGNTDFTLMLKTPIASGNVVGIYDAPTIVNPTLFQVFPPLAVPGWYATLHFGGGNVIVSTFDQFSVFQGSVAYGPISPNSWGFYIQGSNGLWWSEDWRNDNANPKAQVLSYASNNIPGDYWICFEQKKYAAATSRFDGEVLNIQSVRPTPASNATWGMVKGLYH